MYTQTTTTTTKNPCLDMVDAMSFGKTVYFPKKINNNWKKITCLPSVVLELI